MVSGSDVGPVTRFRATPSSSTKSRSRAGIPAAPSAPDKVLQALEDRSVRKAVADIAQLDVGIESRIKWAVDNALTGDSV